MHTALTILGWIVAIIGVVTLLSHSGFALMMRRARGKNLVDDDAASMFSPMLATGFIVDTVLIAGGIALIIFA